ncbi:MAG: metallophosphoesterase [Candidatus Promineifilaceae bacterium]
MIRIAVIGDIHRHFSEFDSRYFNASDYHLILLVGDLSNWWQSEGLEVASLISRLRKMSLFIPGNHDTINAFQLLGEVKKVRPVAELASIGQGRRLGEILRQIDPVIVCGYSVHPFSH